MIELDLESASQIRGLLNDAQQRLAEAREAEEAAAVNVDACRARNALGRTTETKSDLIRAQRALATAKNDRLDLESAVRKLEHGLQLATSRDRAKAQAKWSAKAAAVRKDVQADTAATVALITDVIAKLRGQDEYLTNREGEIKRHEVEAAADGASWPVRGARPLSADYRSWRIVIDQLELLRSVRQPN